MKVHLLYFHSWVTWSNLSRNQSKNYKVFQIRKYDEIFVWQINLHEDLVFQKNNFFYKTICFRQIFLTNIFTINNRIFFAKKTFRKLWRFTKFFHNLKSMIVHKNFLEIKKF